MNDKVSGRDQSSGPAAGDEPRDAKDHCQEDSLQREDEVGVEQDGGQAERVDLVHKRQKQFLQIDFSA